jgi:hypothetical protein
VGKVCKAHEAVVDRRGLTRETAPASDRALSGGFPRRASSALQEEEASERQAGYYERER